MRPGTQAGLANAAEHAYRDQELGRVRRTRPAAHRADGRRAHPHPGQQGHGLSAAVIMGRLRNALRAYALDNDSPEVVLDKLDRKANHFETGTMTTVAYGVIDLAEHRLRLSLAGHLPPVVAVPGEQTRSADIAPDPPIGFDLRARPRHCHTSHLRPPDGAVRRHPVARRRHGRARRAPRRDDFPITPIGGQPPGHPPSP